MSRSHAVAMGHCLGKELEFANVASQDFGARILIRVKGLYLGCV